MEQKMDKKAVQKNTKSKLDTKKVSSEDLASAILAFQQKGGLITKLPPQVALRQDFVGADGGFETVVEAV